MADPPPRVVGAGPYYLRLNNGEPVRDYYGEILSFDTEDEALALADDWENQRAPTWEELQAMSDEEIIERWGAAHGG